MSAMVRRRNTQSMVSPLLPESVAAAIALPAVFWITYFGCAWITAQRAAASAPFWNWERNVPFVPAMIVPYLSLDLLLVGSIFLCGSRSELVGHVKRLMLA